jgi:hypothetical protein
MRLLRDLKEIREAGGRADVVAADLGGTYEQICAFAAEATSTRFSD